MIRRVLKDNGIVTYRKEKTIFIENYIKNNYMNNIISS